MRLPPAPGERVDSINHHAAEIRSLETQVLDTKRKILEASNPFTGPSCPCNFTLGRAPLLASKSNAQRVHCHLKV